PRHSERSCPGKAGVALTHAKQAKYGRYRPVRHEPLTAAPSGRRPPFLAKIASIPFLIQSAYSGALQPSFSNGCAGGVAPFPPQRPRYGDPDARPAEPASPCLRFHLPAMNRGRPAASRSAPQDRPAIEANFAAVRREMNLSSQQIVTLARNLFEACFATE